MKSTYNSDAFEQRMYILVPYNISPIQQGIQSLHAVVEYANANSNLDSYKRWATYDKTVIVLNGGTTNILNGTLDASLALLNKNGIIVSSFYEPDLNNALTGVAFLVDERVYTKKVYQSELENNTAQMLVDLGCAENVFLRSYLKNFRLA